MAWQERKGTAMCDDLAIDEHAHTQESIPAEGSFHLMAVQPRGKLLLTGSLPFTLALSHPSPLQ